MGEGYLGVACASRIPRCVRTPERSSTGKPSTSKSSRISPSSFSRSKTRASSSILHHIEHQVVWSYIVLWRESRREATSWEDDFVDKNLCFKFHIVLKNLMSSPRDHTQRSRYHRCQNPMIYCLLFQVPAIVRESLGCFFAPAHLPPYATLVRYVHLYRAVFRNVQLQAVLHPEVHSIKNRTFVTQVPSLLMVYQTLFFERCHRVL